MKQKCTTIDDETLFSWFEQSLVSFSYVKKDNFRFLSMSKRVRNGFFEFFLEMIKMTMEFFSFLLFRSTNPIHCTGTQVAIHFHRCFFSLPFASYSSPAHLTIERSSLFFSRQLCILHFQPVRRRRRRERNDVWLIKEVVLIYYGDDDKRRAVDRTWKYPASFVLKKFCFRR